MPRLDSPRSLRVALVGGGLALAAILAGCGSSHPSATPSPTTAVAPTSAPSTTAAPTTTHHGTATTAPASRVTSPPPTSAPITEAPPSTTSATSTPGTSIAGIEAGSTTTTSPAATTTAPASSTTSAAPPTTSGTVEVIADCSSASYEPTTIILACGDGGVTATQISWSSWGATSATGSAVIVANLCNPNCAQGSEGSFPASVTLSGVTSGTSGQVFSTLTADYSGASPSGTPSETFSVAPLG